MGICRLSPQHLVRRIDILTIPFHELGAALIYFTGELPSLLSNETNPLTRRLPCFFAGNDIFNRSMRLLANKKGLSLNQRHLSKDVARDNVTKLKITAGQSNLRPSTRPFPSVAELFLFSKRLQAPSSLLERRKRSLLLWELLGGRLTSESVDWGGREGERRTRGERTRRDEDDFAFAFAA